MDISFYINKLPYIYKQLLCLKKQSGLTNEQIESIININIETRGLETITEVDRKISETENKIVTELEIQNLINQAAIEGVEIEGAKFLLENDYYNPDFEIPVSTTTKALSTIDNTKQDLTLQGLTTSVSTQILDGENCLAFQSPNTNLNRIDPAFSLEYLKTKGYELGDEMKVGAWVLVSDATTTNTRRVYFDDMNTLNVVQVVDTNTWQWVEIANNIIITGDSWQQFRLGVRDQVAGEKWYIRGLTILNVTKNTWVGELKSTFLEKQRNLPIVNENPYSRYIHENSMLYDTVYEQLGTDFSKEILKDQVVNNVECDVVKTTGLDSTRHRINFLLCNTPVTSDWRPDVLLLNQSAREITIKIGVWIKVTANANSFSVGIQNDQFRSDDSFRNQWSNETNFGEFKFYESLPAVYSADELKLLENGIIQVDCTPNSGTVEVEIGGICITANNNPLSFRSQIQDNIASSNRFYNKVWTSHGDSTVAFNGWQITANRYLGTNHFNRGIGGTTLANNGSIVYTYPDGREYPDRFNTPTTGTEGVDWLEITGSICTQDRIDGIPSESVFISLTAGINDYGQNVPLGSISDTASDEIGGSFYAAAKSWINKIQLSFPNAEIVNREANRINNEEGSTNTEGHSMQDYRDALENVFNLYGLKTIKITDIGVNSSNWSNYSDDEVHPNRLYEKKIGVKFVNELDSIKGFDYVKLI